MAAWTKLDIIRQAYSEIGKANYEFDLQPEDLQSALRQLDAMMAMWGGTQGIRIGFAGGDGFGKLDVTAEVPLWSVEALYYNLALRLAPSFGKTPSPLTILNAKVALDAVRNRTVPTATRYIGGYGGAGNSCFGVASMPVDVPEMATGPDGTLNFGSGQ